MSILDKILEDSLRRERDLKSLTANLEEFLKSSVNVFWRREAKNYILFLLHVDLFTLKQEQYFISRIIEKMIEAKNDSPLQEDLKWLQRHVPEYI